jgi:Asp-tRNA(Asn)/Glu-tRNA(Gln) amidotransferase A subunit family amidase
MATSKVNHCVRAAVVAAALGVCAATANAFELMEATIADVQEAYKTKQLTAHQLVQMYLDRVAAYDQQGPKLNLVISLNPTAMADADKLDAAYAKSGPVGPLHGVPVFLKDQFDAAGMPSTLGSVLLKDYKPTRDAFVTEKLRKAGAIILGKNTLGELGGGDSYGSLFGESHNPYAPDRTVGGSSGGTGAALAANFSTIGVGEEGSSSIRRPSAWNSVVGMRPSLGLVSRGGMWDGWPSIFGSLGPMARTVTDAAKILDVIAGYDPEDPATAYGVGHLPPGGYVKALDKNALKGARIGVIHQVLSSNSDSASADFKKVDAAYNRAVAEMKAAGATVIDIELPNALALLSKRASGPTEAVDSWNGYFGRNAKDSPFKSRAEMYSPENVAKVPKLSTRRGAGGEPEPQNSLTPEMKHYEYLKARETLMTSLLKVMADNKLDAVVHKSTEHQPNLIKDAITPPYAPTRGVISLNTFLVYVPVVSVPAGFTTDQLPIGMTFLGRPYSDAKMLSLAYSYEQATHHRKPPASTPALTAPPSPMMSAVKY